MKVLDLFSGLEGWSRPFRARGHDVFRVEINPRFPAEHRDVMTLDPRDLPWRPDIILASPPCTAFSVMRIGRNWTHDHQPKTEAARLGLQLLERTLWLIGQLTPRWFIIENPRGKMRRMPQLAHLERRTVTYCQLGEFRIKPTDLWGGFPPSLRLPEPCSNGDLCHMAAPRGSRTGTQGMDSAESAKIPEMLAQLVCGAAEIDILFEPSQPREFRLE